MEALLQKEADVENWNDERMDEPSRRVDEGFEKMATREEMKVRFDGVDRRFDEVSSRFGEIGKRFDEVSGRFEEVGKRFDKVDAQFLQINDRLDRLNHTLLVGLFGLVAAVVANGIWG
jgi:DNA anti-recombination protein RmuC